MPIHLPKTHIYSSTHTLLKNACRFLLVGLACLTASNLAAQTSTISKEEITKLRKQADKHYQNQDFNAALKKYYLLENAMPPDAEILYRIGRCILLTNYQKEKALPYFEQAYSAGKKEALFMLGVAHHELYEFDKALEYFEKFKKTTDTAKTAYKALNVNRHIQYVKSAKTLVNSPVNVTIENMGTAINSPYADYAPIVTADDQEIFFTSRRPESLGRTKDENEEFFEDILYSERDSTGLWQPARHIATSLNTHGHDAVAGLSADGQTLLMYRNDPEGRGGDLYISYLRDTVWTIPKKLPNDISMPGTWEPSACFTANEDALYFSSNRPGGYGGLDIYVAKRLPNGSYGNAQNLGPAINTAWDEDAPFISADGKSLYFSSKGYEQNMGGYDIFVSEKSINGEWDAPRNMGYPINTPDDDVFFAINAEGTHGYYASIGSDTYGEKDIYMIKFTPKPKTLAILKGEVRNTNGKPVAAQILVNKKNNPKLNGLYNANANTAKYMMVLPPGFDYRIIFKAEGYLSDTLWVNAKEFEGFNEVVKNITLYSEKAKDTLQAVRITTTQQVIIGEKNIKTIPGTADAMLSTNKNQTLVDTNGKVTHLSAAINKKDSSDATAQKVTPSVATVRNFTNDCQIDFSDSTHVFTFHFGYKMMQLSTEQYKVLDSVLAVYRKKIIGIKLNAHTDNIGSEKYNMLLSQQRSQAVAAHIKQLGFTKIPIKPCYFGKQKPIAPNALPDGSDYPEGRYKNRRIEVEFFVK